MDILYDKQGVKLVGGKKILDLNNKTILITGAAGFIGSFLAIRLLSDLRNSVIVGIDNLNSYYDLELKKYRLKLINQAADKNKSLFVFRKADISNRRIIADIFSLYHPSVVVNLAAQAGVRYSISNPDSYINTNLLGFYNILEACRKEGENLEHMVYASSSSVYGGNTKVPFNEEDHVDNPVSLYAATKKSNELLAHCYAKLYDMPCTGLRFFTVYGPAGRPDMAYFSFTNKLLAGGKISIFNYGNCKRDFTYIDDIVEGIIKIMMKAPGKQAGVDGLPVAPYSIYNIGNNRPESLLDFVSILSEELVKSGMLPEDFDFEAHKEYVPMQSGDVPLTYADTSKLERDYGFKPSTSLRDGLRTFVGWYKEYYQ